MAGAAASKAVLAGFALFGQTHAFHVFEHGMSCSAGQGITAEGRSMITRLEHFGRLPFSNAGADRNAIAKRFGEGHNIG